MYKIWFLKQVLYRIYPLTRFLKVGHTFLVNYKTYGEQHDINKTIERGESRLHSGTYQLTLFPFNINCPVYRKYFQKQWPA